MPFGEQDGEREPDGVCLTLDDGLNRGSDAVGGLHQVVESAAGVSPGIGDQSSSLRRLPSRLLPASPGSPFCHDITGRTDRPLRTDSTSWSFHVRFAPRVQWPDAGLRPVPPCSTSLSWPFQRQWSAGGARGIDGGGMWGTVVRGGVQGLPGGARYGYPRAGGECRCSWALTRHGWTRRGGCSCRP